MFVQSRSADPFASPNDAQRDAVEHGTDPLPVIAGARSGKMLTRAVAVWAR